MPVIWKGALTFGLLNVPVRLAAATEDHDVAFHQVHLPDGGRVRMRRVCSVDGAEVPYAEIGKGYETADGSTIVVTDEELDALRPARSREMAVVEIVPDEQVDPLLLDRAYYLEPEPTAVKAYVLLRETLAAAARTAIVRVTMRNRTRLGALRVHDEVLALQTMRWSDELRQPTFTLANEAVEISDAERRAADALVAALSEDFHPERFSDEFREQVVAVLEGKRSRGEVVAAREEEAEGAQVVDLLAALQASIARNADRAAAPGRDEPSDRAATGEPAAERPRKKAVKPTAKTPKRSQRKSA